MLLQHVEEDGDQVLAEALVRGVAVLVGVEAAVVPEGQGMLSFMPRISSRVGPECTIRGLDQAVITVDLGNIVYNLPQQDMLALRVVARFGFAVAKPVSRNAPGGGYPFAVLNQA
jgi:hypothetical protein